MEDCVFKVTEECAALNYNIANWSPLEHDCWCQEGYETGGGEGEGSK